MITAQAISKARPFFNDDLLETGSDGDGKHELPFGCTENYGEPLENRARRYAFLLLTFQ